MHPQSGDVIDLQGVLASLEWLLAECSIIWDKREKRKCKRSGLVVGARLSPLEAKPAAIVATLLGWKSIRTKKKKKKAIQIKWHQIDPSLVSTTRYSICSFQWGFPLLLILRCLCDHCSLEGNQSCSAPHLFMHVVIVCLFCLSCLFNSMALWPSGKALLQHSRDLIFYRRVF